MFLLRILRSTKSTAHVPSYIRPRDNKTNIKHHTVPENLIALPFVPDELLELVKKEQLLRDRCRLFNNMFAFSAIGSSGGFEKIPGGPSNVILHGKAYHRMLPGTVFVLHMYR